MRYRIQALLLLISILLPHTASLAQRSGSRSNSKRISNSATGEQEAARFWKTYVAACGGSHYVKRSHAVFVELRAFRIEMKYEPITEADRLNGVQAKGTTSFAATAYRFYEKSAWQPWGNGIPESMNLYNAVRFQKTGGKWIFQPVGYFNRFAQPVSCGEVPGFRPSSANETATNSIQISDYHNFPIEEFFFWESNTNEAGTRFAKSRTTYVNWKVVYSGTAFTYKPPAVQSVWLKDGVEWSRADSSQFSNVSRGQLWAGKGWAEPGNWETGTYSVKLYIRGQLVKVGTFEIVPDSEVDSKLRFDGLYRSEEKEGTGKHDWLRFYEDGRVLLGIGMPQRARLDICVSFQRTKYAMGCTDYSYRTGYYRLSGDSISFSWPEGDDGVLVNITGRVGPNILTLDYDLPTAGVSYKNQVSSFVNVGRLY